MEELNETDRKRLGPVLQKMAHFCAFQERAKSDVLQKLKKVSLSSPEQEYILNRLAAEGFLDEERYVSAFINDKFRLNRWGPVKIAHALKLKQVSSEAISSGMAQLNPENVEELLTELAEKKLETLQHLSSAEKKQKLFPYLLQKGFEPEMIWKVINFSS